MANSFVSVIAAPGQTDFPFNFPNGYLDEAHVHVFVDGFEVARTITGGVAIIAPCVGGESVKVARKSPPLPVITFEDGSILNKQNIDTQTKHTIMLAEEYGEAGGTGGGGSGTGGGSYVGEFPPENAEPNTTWYCTTNGLTYIFLDDGDSQQWVEANPNYPSAVGESDLYVSKSGDTLTGWLYGPRFLATEEQAPEPEALTRKDYVDGTFLRLTGGTSTGPVIVQDVATNNRVDLKADSDVPRVDLVVAGEVKGRLGYDSTTNALTLTDFASNTSVHLVGGRIESGVSYHSYTATAGEAPTALARKDYVDTTLLEVREALEARVTTLEAAIEQLQLQLLGA